MTTEQANEMVLNITTLFAILGIMKDEPVPLDDGLEPADYRESNYDGRWTDARIILEQWNRDPDRMSREQQQDFLKKLSYVWDVVHREWLWDLFDRTKSDQTESRFDVDPDAPNYSSSQYPHSSDQLRDTWN